MIYFLTNLHAFLILLVYLILFPLKNCGKVTTFDNLDNITQVTLLVTRKPSPWGELTVPSFLSAHIGSDTDLESFKTFVYILLSICFGIIIYYFLKCTKCLKACTIVLWGTRDSFRRRQNTNFRRSSPTSIDRASRSRIARRIRVDHQYERILPQLHNSRRHRIPNRLPTGNLERNARKSQSPDKPPDYSSVVSQDWNEEQHSFPEVNFPALTESPPPSYNESFIQPR